MQVSLEPSWRDHDHGSQHQILPADYWDFADHLLPLSHLTVLEHLACAGLDVVAVHDRFLPYSFRSRLPTHPRLVHLYLSNPWAWQLLGKQFLIRAFCPSRDRRLRLRRHAHSR